MLSRRKFLISSALSGILAKSPAVAFAHENEGQNPNRVVLNAVSGYLNLAKGFGFTVVPNNSNSDGYPITTPAGNLIAGSSPSMPGQYFGQFVWKWTGQGSMQLAAKPMIITSGGLAILGFGSASGDFNGDGGGHVSLVSRRSPRLVFSFGINIQRVTQSPVSNGSGGNLIRIETKRGFASNLSTGDTMNVSGILTQTNANGKWTITVVDTQTFDLQASTWSAGKGSSGVVGQAILQATNLSISILAAGTFSSFGGLVWCKISDETDINNGLLVDSTLIGQLRYLLNPNDAVVADAWLRFMDLIGVQNSYECDFSERIPASYISYAATNVRPGYWTTSARGAITSDGSDNYSCANPSNSDSGAYVDNEIVQGVPNVSNRGTTPTMNVGGRGARPVFDSNCDPLIIDIFAAAPSLRQKMGFSFSATWLNSGLPYVFTYTTTATGPFGNDTSSVSILRANVRAALAADTTLAAAKIQFGNSGAVVAFPRTAQAGKLTISYTLGPAIVRTGSFYAAGITGGTTSTFIYNYLLDGWIYQASGMTNSIPLEVIAEMCNRVGANCWFNWGTTKGAWVTAVTGFFRDNLNAGLKFGAETGNEVWNGGANPFHQWNSLGQALGFSIGGNAAVYGYTSLRTIQYQALSKIAWTTTRSASTLYTFQMSATFDSSFGGNFEAYQLKGTQLDASANAIYGTYGGLNGSGSAASHDVSPNRPVDITTAIGMAPYWGSLWWAGTASVISGTIAQNAPWLHASLDFTNGLTTTAYTSLVNQFNGTTTRSGGSVPSQTFSNHQTLFASQESVAAQYDSGRPTLGLAPLAIIHYEGGPNWAVGANINNGVNSVNSTDIAALANQMTALGWDVSPYTKSGTNNATEAATQVITMTQAWKFDVSYKNLIKLYSYQALKNTSGVNRETKPAQYGYSGSQWGLFPSFYSLGGQYSSYDAIHEFDL
jgi:hypothetical protein